MILGKALRLALGDELASLLGLTGPPVALTLCLIKEDFVPSETLVPSSLTEADFDGYAAVTIEAVDQDVGIDPVTQEQIVTIREPAGGWRFQASGAGSLPQTIYGYVIVRGATLAAGSLAGCKRLDVPVTFNAALEEMNLGTVKLAMPSVIGQN